MENDAENLLYESALVWKRLTEYKYIFTYGFKNRLYEINLFFNDEDYPHLAGFQYLKDITFKKRYNGRKIADAVMDNEIKFEQVVKGIYYEEKVKPRLNALVRMDKIFDSEFILYSFIPQKYKFSTRINADYLISCKMDNTDFVFIIKDGADKKTEKYLCCSVFEKGTRDFAENQKKLAILKKERINIKTGVSEILYNRLK